MKVMCFLNLPDVFQPEATVWSWTCTFNDPKHNGTQSRLKTSLEKVAKKYDVQLGEGSDAWIASIAWIGDLAYRV